MLKRLADYLRAAIGPTHPQGDSGALELATAVLLTEVMLADAEIAPMERTAIQAALRHQFKLTDQAAARLLEMGEHAARDAYDFQRFTALLNRELSAAEKVQIVEHMWQVAFADEHISAHENHLLRKIAALLYIPHADYVAAKQRARTSYEAQ
jgi:uncharacterized tellurite resistance protein B-like protein